MLNCLRNLVFCLLGIVLLFGGQPIESIDDKLATQKKYLNASGWMLSKGPAVCYAPDTSSDRIEEHTCHQADYSSNSSFAAFQFDDSDRWSSTATNGSGLPQGEPTTITWSIVPDGTMIDGFNGEPDAASDLIAFLDGIYPDPNNSIDIVDKPWFIYFEEMFESWGELTGVTYIYEANDDGSRWRQQGPYVNIPSGQLGVRGDVRIGGHYIDGTNDVLAYNFFPNIGDMVIDTGDSFFNDTSNDSRKLRNVLAHEHGHGIGLGHVCPVSQSKLMEPFVSTLFVGPQFDDILAGHRGYGDPFEDNDTFVDATFLPTPNLGETLIETGISIDDNSDVDIFSIYFESGSIISVTVTPTGPTYLSGQQNSNGSCSAGTNFNAVAQSNLWFEIIAPNQSSVLATANSTAAGYAENVIDLELVDGNDDYYVRIYGNDNAAQMYDLAITVEPVCEEVWVVSQPEVLQVVCLDEMAIFSVEAVGTDPINYQWRKNAVNLPGQTDPNLILDNIQPSDNGFYDVVVTNACGSETSSLGQLIVEQIDSPVLDDLPENTIGVCQTIFWDSVVDAEQYLIEFSDDPNFNSVIDDSGWIIDLSHEFCGLEDGMTYYYRGLARTDNHCESAPSDSVFSTQCDSPADQNEDCVVDFVDLAIFAEHWLFDCNVNECDRADINEDAFVNLYDYSIFTEFWP